MPENININGRRSIHERDAQTPQREDSEYADDSNLNESQEQITTESDSFALERIEGKCSPPERSRREEFEISRSVPRTPQRPKLQPFNASTKNSYIPESNKTKETLKKEATGFFNTCLFTFAIVVLVVAVIFASIYYYTNVPQTITQTNCSYEKLEEQYPKEGSWLWRSLKTGIESILNKRTEKPGVYLFVHHGGKQSYQLVKDIAAHSSSCFGQEMRAVEMQSADFISSATTNDYGHTIEKYKMKIKEGNVILIANLNEIPAEAARALHPICDTHSPIAKDVVIFLTLTIPPIVEGNVETNAEDTLIKLWGPKLKRNELDPLITRVTDQVIALQS